MGCCVNKAVFGLLLHLKVNKSLCWASLCMVAKVPDESLLPPATGSPPRTRGRTQNPSFGAKRPRDAFQSKLAFMRGLNFGHFLVHMFLLFIACFNLFLSSNGKTTQGQMYSKTLTANTSKANPHANQRNPRPPRLGLGPGVCLS